MWEWFDYLSKPIIPNKTAELEDDFSRTCTPHHLEKIAKAYYFHQQDPDFRRILNRGNWTEAATYLETKINLY
jgi:hypothetical protein